MDCWRNFWAINRLYAFRLFVTGLGFALDLGDRGLIILFKMLFLIALGAVSFPGVWSAHTCFCHKCSFR